MVRIHHVACGVAVKLTADTITDQQIRELRAAFTGLTVAPHVNGLCDLALASTDEARVVLALKPGRRKKARARLAKIINSCEVSS